ncbi:MAG: alpha/beta hydrolase [Oscillospiraceae bacterium]|nr:alpha/beta hydrolase [Oscillospiraceae bacterium]
MSRNIKNGSVVIGDTEMYYASFGSGKRTLVVLPGLSDGLATVKGKAWMLAAPYKGYLDDFSVYLFSRKNKMPEGTTIQDMAADQIEAMKKLGIRKASVLGVSQGGMIAQYMAIDHPEAVERLVLAVTAPCANDTVKNAVTGWVEMAKQGDHKALMIDTAEKMYSKAYLEKKSRLFPLLARFTKPASYERFYRNAEAILSFDAREELDRIRCPTLILAGENDLTVGNEAAGELKSKIAGSRLVVFSGLGHGAFEESPEFYDKVFDFISE